MVIRRVAPLRVWVDYVGGGGLGEVGAVAAGELSRRNRERPVHAVRPAVGADHVPVRAGWWCAHTGPRSTTPVCEVVECAELCELVGGHWGLPQWGGPSVPIRVSCVPDGRERQRALRAKGTRRGSVL